MSKMRSFARSYLRWHFATAPRRMLQITNDFVDFLTHFFSVPLLLHTLFSPWHGVIATKKRPGWHLNEIFARLSFNVISRIIGVILRLAMIFGWFIFTAEFTLFALIIILLWFFLPLLTLPFYLQQQRQIPRKQQAAAAFIRRHALDPVNRKEAAKWFTYYWQQQHQHFWQKDVLLSIPSPVAKWHYGYTPLLDKYSRDLTNGIYLAGRQIIGRNREVNALLRILSRPTQPAALLYGPAGSGRHAVIYALARRIATDAADLPPRLKYHRVIKLGTAYFQTDERLLRVILSEAARAGNIILVFDEVNKLTFSLDILAPFVQNGSLKLIGLISIQQYQRTLQKNELAQKLFATVEVAPLPPQHILRLLEDKADHIEKKYALLFPVETLKEIIRLGEQAAGNQPDSSLDLLEEISVAMPNNSTSGKKTVITPRMLSRLAEEKLKIPLVAAGAQEKRKLANLEELLHQHVINQVTAITELANALRRARLKLESPNRPLASFLFLGPTGVGKTATAKALARVYFAAATAVTTTYLLRFDMSNYQNKQDAQRLIQQLAAAIRQQPYGVLLLDEIEKAQQDLLNLFLTILDEGYFTDLDGDSVSCRSLLIIGTSNAASEFIRENLQTSVAKMINDTIEYTLRKGIFTPEFVNRFDGVIVFEPLDKEALRKIARLKLQQLNCRLQRQYQTTIPITDRLINQIVERGYKPEFGARELNRAIQHLVENPFAKKLLETKQNN